MLHRFVVSIIKSRNEFSALNFAAASKSTLDAEDALTAEFLPRIDVSFASCSLARNRTQPCPRRGSCPH